MKRFGLRTNDAPSKMDRKFLFNMRLQLLIIMVKARLEGYPVGEYRKAAVMETAARLHKDVSQMDIRIKGSRAAAHLFRERVKLLSVMATAMVSDAYPLGIHRREAVMDNIDSIISIVFPAQDFSQYRKILNAA